MRRNVCFLLAACMLGVSSYAWAQAPQLVKKERLAKPLLAGATSITGKGITPVTPFAPSGDYSLEVKATVTSSAGCGLSIEARADGGKGFRVTLSAAELSWATPLADADKLADASGEVTLRFVVQGEQVHIYKETAYIASKPVADVDIVDENGAELLPVPLTLSWAGAEGENNLGSGKYTDYGWSNSATVTNYNDANASGGLRYMDVANSAHAYNGEAYSGRIMILRWDGTYGTFTFPVTLKPATTYEFSMLGEYWSNTKTTMTVGVDTTRGTEDDNTGSIATAIASEVISFGSNNVLQKYTLSFTTLSAALVPSGEYYLAFNAPSGGMFGIAELAVSELPAGYSAGAKLSLAKYCDGAASISVSAVDYEDWAYAPGREELAEPLAAKGELGDMLTTRDLALSGGSGSKAVHTLAPLALAGDYTVEVAATVDTATKGRGMDFEVRANPLGYGLRTALNSETLAAASPYSLPLENIAGATGGEQVLRYAVKGDNVHVFLNNAFVRTFTALELGEMNAAGTAEITASPNTTFPVENNLIANPEFAETEVNAAPAGWTSNAAMGGGTTARVQSEASNQLGYYGGPKKAFLVRFDGSYTHFSYAVELEANTRYEYSFDLVTWGSYTNQTFTVMVVDSVDDGTANVIATKVLTTQPAGATVHREALRFQTTGAGTYYLMYQKIANSPVSAITDLALIKDYSASRILVGKNYTADTAGIRVRYVAVDAGGAYAPVPGTVVQTGQQIAFDSIPAQYLSAGQYQLTEAKASSGLPVSYAGDNDAVATVTPEGLITFVSAGTLTITASQPGNDRYSAASDTAQTFTISSATPQTIAFDSLAVQDFAAGTLQLSATASSGLPVTFSGSDTAVATVTPEGLVTFVGAGTLTITAAQAGGEIAGENYDPATPEARPLTIVKPLTGIAFESPSIDLRQGSALQLLPILTPADPTNAQLAWTSSDPDLVSVSSEGLLTAKLAGEVVITASGTDSGIVASHTAVATGSVSVRVTPSLVKKENLATVLLSAATPITGKTEIPVTTSFKPKGEYSVEVKATVTSATGCGLDIEARTPSGVGFRVSLTETELRWAAPFASPEKLADATAAVEVALRLVVQGEQVHIYKGEDYITTKAIVAIGDVENGVEQFPEAAPVPVAIGCWDGCDGDGTQKDYGWDNTNADYSGWNTLNGSGGMRIMTDVNTLTYKDSAYNEVAGHDDRYMYIRWDAGDIIGTVWSFPIREKLEAGATYKLSLLCAYNSNSRANMIIGVGGSRSASDPTQAGVIADALNTKEVDLTTEATAVSKALKLEEVTFTTDTAGQYYILISAPKGGNNGPLCVITAPELNKLFSVPSKLALAKRCDGAANISVAQVSYEDRAWAPGKETLTDALTAKAYLSDTLVGTPAQRDLILVGASGSKATQKLWFPASGDYTVEVAATIADTSVGRGMDAEVHDEAGYGFRLSLNSDELAAAAPFSGKDWIADAASGEQILRYAVKGDNVHVFFNNAFVRTFSKQALGGMDADGTAETAALATANPLNLIGNPDFAETAVDGWPEGWKTDAPSYGVYGTPRVLQSATDVLAAYPAETKALMLRFDSSDPLVAKYYSYPVALKPETAYEYSFDLLAWGGGRENQSYFLVVSDKENGTVSYTETINEEEATVVEYSVSGVGENGVIALDTITTTAASGTRGARQTLRFTTPASANAVDTFYLSFAKMAYSGEKIFGITYQSLLEAGQSSVGVLLGKNYTAGAADVQVRYVTVDGSGAYAPVAGTTPVVTGQDILFDSIPVQYQVHETYRLTEARATSRLPIAYSGDNDAVATVTPQGLVTFAGVGEVTITASVTATSPVYTAVGSVSRKLVVSSMLPQTITFAALDSQYLSTGALQVAATATSGLPVTFAGDNDNVATVTPEGLVTFVGLGTVNITASQAGGTAGAEVYDAATPVTRALVIRPKPVAGVALNVTSRDLYVGDTLLLEATVTPDDATDKSVTWSSSNTSVASVTADGATSRVIAVAAGSANITVATVDGPKRAVCQLIVRSRTTEEPNSVDGLGRSAVSAYVVNGDLVVSSPAAELVEVYSVAGAKLLERSKQAGVDKISVAHLQPQILIVRGSAGWARKVLNK
jgi:uncharacterized protein YjdB